MIRIFAVWKMNLTRLNYTIVWEKYKPNEYFPEMEEHNIKEHQMTV